MYVQNLYKKGDREDITNWGPLSLLKYHNKIYTKILANKIQSALEDIITPEQTVAIKIRVIIKNLKLNRDVMSNANANKIQTTRKIITKKNRLTGWKIKTVCQNIEAQVKVNGHLS